MALTAQIDLTTASTTITETDPQLLERFLGGRGLAARMLYDLVGPEVEPLSPENVLILSTGPLSGTAWPTSSRLHVTFKSPLTGAYGYANTGGFVGPELRHAGFDTVVIRGRAASPAFLRIEDDQITFHDAAQLWGQTTDTVHRILLGDRPMAKTGRVICIGPAGENLVRIAALINDFDRAAARCGPGAVMGSKNLKAIHVRASRKPRMTSEMRHASMTATNRVQADSKLDGLRSLGTVFLMDPKNATGDQPAKNHQLVQVPFIQEVNAASFDKYLVRHKACYACPIACSRYSAVEDGDFAVELEGPEYETTNALGPMCWIRDPEAILYANKLCNQYGLDTISTGVTIAFAMELHEKGLLDDERLSLEWGDETTVMGLIEGIALRQGLGDLLADGTLRAAEQIGPQAVRYAMQVKGMELPRQEPRFAKGFGLGHATSNRGADHLYGLPGLDLSGNIKAARRIFPEQVVRTMMDPADETYKPDMLVYGENFCAVVDSLGVCKFSTAEVYSLMPDDLAPGVSATLGGEWSGPDLLGAGERIVNLERMYNVRQGLDRKDDALPLRFIEEPAPVYDLVPDPGSEEMRPEGEPIAIGVIRDLDAMLDRYYDLRGWSRNGIPKPDTLRRLELDDIASAG